MEKLLDLGTYSIWESPADGTLWIGHQSGEGMQVTKEELEKAIEKFYLENF